MPFNRLAIPFVLLLALSVYLTVEVGQIWAIPIVIFAVILIAGYVLSPLINWWWWEHFPPDLDKGLHGLLEHKVAFYRQLNNEGRREFRRRLFLFNQGTNFRPQGLETVADDAKLMIAVAPIAMGFENESFLFEKFENIVVYKHIFPSPQFPEQFHASEIYEEDGVVMLCLEHVSRGFIQADQFFNPAWYEYAKVYQLAYPNQNYGDWTKTTWADLEQICGFSKEALEEFIGLPDLDIEAFGIACFFLYPESFQKYLPKMFHSLEFAFCQKK